VELVRQKVVRKRHWLLVLDGSLPAMSDADDKKKLYYLLVTQGMPAAILERMRLHGFWPTGVEVPPDPPDEAKERAALEGELAQLAKRGATLKDPDKALAEERIRRWQESKQRRAEKKKAREAELQKRRAAWHEAQKQTIVHAGRGVSGRLSAKTGQAPRATNTAALLQRGLPILESSTELAQALGMTLARLRWLTYHRRCAALVHYHRYGIPKKTGGIRHISAPKQSLAQAQRWVHEQILEKLTTEAPAHGFVKTRNVVSNALPHVNKKIVVNLDLRDFFPSVTFRRVQGLFHKLGYGDHVATVLALLCTEPPRVATELDGKVFYVALSERVLPQGACTSPAITNALCRRLDRRLAGIARRYQAAYTRYADDLTFSVDDDKVVAPLLSRVRAVIRSEGFAEHEDKTHVMRRSRRQEVTGVVVNVRPTLSREERRELRAILHNAARHGLESQNREGRADFAAYLQGRVAYLCMVDPKRAEQYRAALAQALAQSARTARG
jgi:retron-type reverse transcriptase